ncbi:MAG: hypothetical protein HZB23_07370 [Deltaproteobacteria bacterium]|nr:hypothetical protein [Deltaproteobacteria bacterium]
MSLQQMNIGFSPVEDRLILRITGKTEDGSAEYRFWLTRRLVRLLWDGLEKVLEADTATDPRVDPEAREMVKQWKEEEAISKADFTTPFTPAPMALPLGEAPILVSKIQLKSMGPDQKVVVLNNEAGVGITLALKPEMIHSIRKLIADAALKAEWDLDLSVLAGAAALSADGHRIIN